MIPRRGILAGLAASAMPAVAMADTPERTDVTISMGVLGLNFLPLLLADVLGLFKQQGLNVTVLNFGTGGSASLKALLGGSTDTTIASYDHTIQMQAQGKEIEAIFLNNPLPGLVLAVRQDLVGKVKDIHDFKGLRVGVTVPGASGDFLMKYMLKNAGMDPDDVVFIGVGSGNSVIAAIDHKNIDLLLNYDPAITLLEQRGAIKIILDTRTEEGTRAAYGGDYPFLCLYSMRNFIDRNPVTMQRMTNALVQALRYLHGHTALELIDAIAPKYKLGERNFVATVLDKSWQTYSKDGRFDPASLQTPLRILSAFDEKVARAKIDLNRTYTNRFVDAALSG